MSTLHQIFRECSFFVLFAAPYITHGFAVKQCVKIKVSANGDAQVANLCSERINVSYCGDNFNSTKPCSSKSISVTAIEPGSADTTVDYANIGAGPIYWAVCMYPEAAVEWKPGPDSSYACRKTCVMC